MTVDARPRLFVVEDHDIVRYGIERLLESRFHLVGSADEVASAIDLIRERVPDVVLLDVSIPGGGGALVVEAVRRTHPQVKFLAFTVSTSRHDVLRLLRAGANGYVVKSTDRRQLADLVDQVLMGGLPISPDVAGYLLDIDDERLVESEFARLTEREREVATLIAQGLAYREVAEALGVSIKTLESHLHHIFAKLGVHSRHELSQVAYQTGFLGSRTMDEAPPSGTVSFLLTRIADADRLWGKTPESMLKLLAAHDRLFGRSITSAAGHVVRSTGDGMVGVFARASSALEAALAGQRAITIELPGGPTVKAAVVTGESDAHNGDYTGIILDNAAAYLERCPPGSVVATEVTRRLGSSRLSDERMEWRLLTTPKTARNQTLEPLYEVVGLGP